MTKKKVEEGGRVTFTFSLTQGYSDRIDTLTTLVPRTNRSDVLKAAIDAFEALPVDKKREFLTEVLAK